MDMRIDNVRDTEKGRTSLGSAVHAGDRTIVVAGKHLKIARFKDEWYAGTDNPDLLRELLRQSGMKADLITFMQRPPDTTPKFGYYMEWDNLAAVPLTNMDVWWKNQIPKQTRNHVRRAQKSGIIVRIAEFDDALVKGISEIYNESPIRQGRRFWHYGKDLESIRNTHSTYLDTCDFIGAYLHGELIGFVKLVYVGETARTMQIISMFAHRDKAPTNALIAKAVEICCEKGIRYLVYGKYDYGKASGRSLAMFKKENGFQKVLYPRYYIPLNLKGEISLKLKLHRGIREMLPEGLIFFLLEGRKKWYLRKYGQG